MERHPRRDGPEPGIPDLGRLRGEIEDWLARFGELGLLSVSLIRRKGQPESCWGAYEQLLEQVSVGVTEFRVRRLRHTDRLLAPLIAGNTLVLLVTPPRDGRALQRSDMSRVRYRLLRALDDHLARTVASWALEPFGVHVGWSRMRHDPEVPCRRIVHRALDEAMADAMHIRAEEKRVTTGRLRRILRGGQVRTVYQPVVDLVDRSVIGYEALTRLPRRQFRTPDLMFRAAQEHGSLWTLERLCRRAALEHAPPIADDQLLFLNIEPESIHDPQLRRDSFLDQLARAGLSPARTVLELTEHTAVRDFPTVRRAIRDVRALGFRLAMDDVGSGHAGLQSIAELRPDFLKVDMALVRNVHLDPIKRELISTIRRFGESTGMALVAEGVESREELQSLSEVGVRCAQGFLFAEPDSPPRTPDWRSLAPVKA